MDQASASPAASCAHNPAAPRTLPSWQPSEDQARTVGPPPARSSPRSEPHSEPVHIVPRPSSPALCQSDAKGYLLPNYYSGATGIPGRFSEGLLLRRSQAGYIISSTPRTEGQRHGRVATFAEHNLTSEEEAQLHDYLQYMRSRKRPVDQS